MTAGVAGRGRGAVEPQLLDGHLDGGGDLSGNGDVARRVGLLAGLVASVDQPGEPVADRQGNGQDASGAGALEGGLQLRELHRAVDEGRRRPVPAHPVPERMTALDLGDEAVAPAEAIADRELEVALGPGQVEGCLGGFQLFHAAVQQLLEPQLGFR